MLWSLLCFIGITSLSKYIIGYGSTPECDLCRPTLCQPMPSVLWRCWLGGRKGIRPVKNWVVGCWHGYLSGPRCKLVYGPAVMPLPLTVSCFSEIQTGFTFLVPAHTGSPGQRAVKRACVCVCVTAKAERTERENDWIDGRTGGSYRDAATDGAGLQQQMRRLPEPVDRISGGESFVWSKLHIFYTWRDSDVTPYSVF